MRSTSTSAPLASASARRESPSCGPGLHLALCYFLRVGLCRPHVVADRARTTRNADKGLYCDRFPPGRLASLTQLATRPRRSGMTVLAPPNLDVASTLEVAIDRLQPLGESLFL